MIKCDTTKIVYDKYGFARYKSNTRQWLLKVAYDNRTPDNSNALWHKKIIVNITLGILIIFKPQKDY